MIVTELVFVFVDPHAFVTVRLTVYVPAAMYVWLGFCNVLVPPSPKFHDQVLIVPVEVSVKFMMYGFVPTDELKFAVTVAQTVM
jgi:hypothetical protein